MKRMSMDQNKSSGATVAVESLFTIAMIKERHRFVVVFGSGRLPKNNPLFDPSCQRQSRLVGLVWRGLLYGHTLTSARHDKPKTTAAVGLETGASRVSLVFVLVLSHPVVLLTLLGSSNLHRPPAAAPNPKMTTKLLPLHCTALHWACMYGWARGGSGSLVLGFTLCFKPGVDHC